MRVLRHLVLLFLSGSAFAQFTTVSGTVTDPNGLPYAGGTITPTLISSASPVFTATKFAYTPPTQPVGLSNNGSFVMQLADVTQLTPGGSTYNFQVCSGPNATVLPAFGKGPVCFSVTGISISGASQSITTTLTAAALALTSTFSSTGITCSGTCASPFLPVFTGAATVADSVISATANTILMPGVSNALTPSANGSAVQSFQKPSGGCAGTNSIPLPTIGCVGMDTRMLPTNLTSIGTFAGLSVLSSNLQGSATTLQLGIYAQAQAAVSTTESRAIYAEAYDNNNSTTTTRRGLFAFAGNGTGNTTTTNEPLVAESYTTSGSTNTNDFTMHCLAPGGLGTLTTHACIKVDAQGTGVEFQTAPHVFSALPTCNATYEGSYAGVTDATSATNGATVVGSGTHHVLAYCNGTSWLVVVGT